jgi:hypothetical protein
MWFLEFLVRLVIWAAFPFVLSVYAIWIANFFYVLPDWVQAYFTWAWRINFALTVGVPTVMVANDYGIYHSHRSFLQYVRNWSRRQILEFPLVTFVWPLLWFDRERDARLYGARRGLAGDFFHWVAAMPERRRARRQRREHLARAEENVRRTVESLDARGTLHHLPKPRGQRPPRKIRKTVERRQRGGSRPW